MKRLENAGDGLLAGMWGRVESKVGNTLWDRVRDRVCDRVWRRIYERVSRPHASPF